MSRNTRQWMTICILALTLFSGETSASRKACHECDEHEAPCFKDCNPCTTCNMGFLPKGAYFGIFGGGGAVTNTHISQRGTAFFTEATGGPLAVDATGHVTSNSAWFAGAHIGFAAPVKSCITPAVELEGFYFRANLHGTLDAPHTALPEHTFNDSFSTRSGVFLLNNVFTFNNPCWMGFHPYVGVGIGGATLTASGADSLQVSPLEAGVNHFNTETSANDSAFAAQVKVGLSYDITPCVALFAEYRYLYIGPTSYTFGSTVYPNHAPTSPWLVNVDGMNYNLGAVGINVSI